MTDNDKPKRSTAAELFTILFFLAGLGSFALVDVQYGIFFMLAALVTKPRYW